MLDELEDETEAANRFENDPWASGWSSIHKLTLFDRDDPNN
jgi:hypothetical protein